MGQKHNRRRTRETRSQKRASTNFHSTVPPTTILDTPFCFTSINNYRTSINLLYLNNLATYARTFIPVLSAKQRLMACQNREQKLLQDVVMIEADQYRLFGGEPGDDVSLCYRMLEYFGGLDYIES
ncbi:hypothetical protein V8E54_010932 [Elaphomyces granulatus]